MNIYDFFNSPDVAEYCQSIGHIFNAVESAVIVSQSRKHSFEEKVLAYKTIIAEYPDMKLERGNNHDEHESFHKALGDLIIYEERRLAKFFEPEADAIYQLKYVYERSEDTYYGDDIFSSFEKALAYAVESFNEEFDTHISWIIRKTYIDNDKDWIDADISISGKIIDIDNSIPIPKENKIDPWLLSIYIDAPVPFKKGDLVESSVPGSYGDVYVLLSICRDDTELNEKSLYRSDMMDMTACIHYEDDGSVYWEVMHFYPNLQYCRRELKGEKRILKYISLHLKDKLCLCSLLEVQKLLLADKMLNSCREHHELEYQLKSIDDKLLEI